MTARLLFVGALVAGWLLLWGDLSLANILTGTVLVWYVIDGAISLATGFALNAVSNTALLTLYLFPVLRSGVLRG